MANHEINEEQEAVNKALRMIETSDPVHADVYNALFSILINNDVFLEKLANKMVQQVMISHVMDSTNPDMVMGADQGPVITKLIEKVQEQVNVLNTNQNRTAIIKAGYAQFSNIKWAASASYTCVVSDQNIKKSDILLTGIRIVGSTAENYGLRFWVDDGYISCNCTSLIAGNNTTVGFWYLLIRSAISE